MKYRVLLTLLLASLLSCKFDPAAILASSKPHERFSRSESLTSEFTHDFELRFMANPINETEFSFLIITDTHYGENESPLLRVHEYWKQNPYDLLVVAGDITQRGAVSEWEEFNRDRAVLGTELYLAIGNHDLFNDGEEQFYTNFGPTHYVQQIGDITLVFLDTGNGVIAKDEKSWYVNTLEKYRDTQIITITHYSVITDYVQNLVALPNPDEFYWIASVNAQYGVKAMVAGHLHTNLQEKLKGVDYYAVANLANTDQPQGLLVKYENDKLSLERVSID